MRLALVHLILVAGWIGILGAEGVLEFVPLRRPDLRAATAVFHYYIDLLVELPLLVGIMITGGLLLFGRAIDLRLALKLAGAAAALAANLVCIGIVVVRHRGSAANLESRSRKIYAVIALGAPGFLIALYLGLGYGGLL